MAPVLFFLRCHMYIKESNPNRLAYIEKGTVKSRDRERDIFPRKMEWKQVKCGTRKSA